MPENKTRAIDIIWNAWESLLSKISADWQNANIERSLGFADDGVRWEVVRLDVWPKIADGDIFGSIFAPKYQGVVRFDRDPKAPEKRILTWHLLEERLGIPDNTFETLKEGRRELTDLSFSQTFSVATQAATEVAEWLRLVQAVEEGDEPEDEQGDPHHEGAEEESEGAEGAE